MTFRQCTIWSKKIAAHENAKTFDRVYVTTVSDASTNHTTGFLNITDRLSADQYQLYNARECKDWLEDRVSLHKTRWFQAKRA